MKYFIIRLRYICFEAIEHLRGEREKKSGTQISTHTLRVPEYQLHALKEKETMKLISNGPRGDYRLSQGENLHQ
jgi:hypothetical protein